MRYLTLALLALALPLAACGGGDDASDERTTTTAGGAFPVTVEHKYGKTTVESEPKRVVTVGYTDQDATLALGVVPVGVGDFLGGYEWRERPWAQDALKGAEPEVVSGQEINFEAVAAQRPDLIVAINAGLKQADYEKLSQLAPTVAQSGDYIDFGMPWDEQTLLVGKALGREDRASRSSPTSTRASSASAPITPSSTARPASSPTAARRATAPTPPRTRAAASSPTSASRPPRRSTSSPARASSPSSARSSSGSWTRTSS